VIRINLAPIEARARRGPAFSLSLPSFNLGVVFAIVYVAALGSVGYYWFSLQAEETRVAADVDRLNRELTSLKATLGQGASVRGQLAEVKRVQAKTGSLGGVKTLSGYATTNRGERVAFSILSNNFNLPDNFLGSPTFGRITSARDPRHVQFGVKLLF